MAGTRISQAVHDGRAKVGVSGRWYYALLLPPAERMGRRRGKRLSVMWRNYAIFSDTGVVKDSAIALGNQGVTDGDLQHYLIIWGCGSALCAEMRKWIGPSLH